MKKSLLIASTLLLTACSQGTISHDDLMKNPLYAERYSEDMVDQMVELFIQKDPVTEEKRKADYLNKARETWTQKAKDATALQLQGGYGTFIELKQVVTGQALYLNDVLYFGPEFDMRALPNTRVYLTTVSDPRAEDFLETGEDLGPLKSAYGAQQYTVPHQETKDVYRTVVLYDPTLDYIISFAQLSFR